MNYQGQNSYIHTIANASPVHAKSTQTIQSNITQFILFPSIKFNSDYFDSKAVFLKNKLSYQIMQSRIRNDHSQGHDDRNNYLTSPTFLGQENHSQSLHPNFFNTIHLPFKQVNIRPNMLVKDFILEENNQFMDENVTIEKWARTQRQRILMNISFDSDYHNIYNPVFSSENSGSRSVSSIEKSVYQDFSPIRLEGSRDEFSSGSSTPSVAEERDTISLTPNAITPNLSRIMNICSISKIDQLSILNPNTEISPLPYRAPKSQLSFNKTKPKKVYQFQRTDITGKSYQHSVINDEIANIECVIVQEPQFKFKQQSENINNTDQKQRLQISQISIGDSLPVPGLLSRGSNGRNISNIIMSHNHVMQNTNNYKTEPNDSIFMSHIGSIQHSLPYQDFQQSGQKSPAKIQLRTKQTSKINHNKPANRFLKKKVSIDQGSFKSKITYDNTAMKMKRDSSNHLLNFEQSSIINPYETLYGSPQQLMDKSTTIGNEIRTSLLTTGATEAKNPYRKNKQAFTQKAPGTTAMRNSQSMSNLNLQPRAFITRNVKIRKNNNQSQFGLINPVPVGCSSDFQVTPVNQFTRRNIDIGFKDEVIREISLQKSQPQSSAALLVKKEQSLQLKRQRLARDILLSKVYNSNNQQLVINTHKKTNTTIQHSNNFNHQQFQQISLSKVGSVKQSQAQLKTAIKKSSGKIDQQLTFSHQNNGATNFNYQHSKNEMSMSYFNKPLENKPFIRSIASTTMKNSNFNSQSNNMGNMFHAHLPTINNFLK
ncbi:UNKNOWN [Stylonychia lemnae]|uniref:Uncharacterized protein n=1 Tax=Stylonychia lemnae TaxID=5949 RepID=A0A078BDM0_STYLE|nr:UNKNOWN [Stylonychia lemnae]|eukprot:CDW91683.1 UNKNOWN [Stylonychia lemnae]